MQTLPGFREYYPEEQSVRSLIGERWADVARRFGFAEVATPTLEPLELYQKKSGDELVGQLFAFEDKGERAVALRPELTPAVARMVVNRNRELRKPVRWFSNGMFFRFERPQKGRLREFGQFNCDLFGVSGPGADGEMIQLLIELLRATGLSERDFAVRISDREVWAEFAAREGVSQEKVPQLLQVIDKLGREKEERSAAALAEIGVGLDRVRTYMGEPVEEYGRLGAVMKEMRSRGVG
ncbi:MAG: ATP phosphoribosyltransferase regulatory subunit, partial [Verrucomicrobiia bacterium]